MRILFDTSVLVAALIETHPMHKSAFARPKRVVERADEGFVSAHSVAELYAVLTTLPVHPTISANQAEKLIKHNIVRHFQVVALTDRDYFQVIADLAKPGIRGGATYDALILRVAVNENLDGVFTLNVKDFQRVYPELADRITLP